MKPFKHSTNDVDDFMKHQQEVYAWVSRPNADVVELNTTILRNYPGVTHLPIGFVKDGMPFNPISNREHLMELIQQEGIIRLNDEGVTNLIITSSKLRFGCVVIDMTGVTSQEEYTMNELLACTTLLYILGEMRNE